MAVVPSGVRLTLIDYGEPQPVEGNGGSIGYGGNGHRSSTRLTPPQQQLEQVRLLVSLKRWLEPLLPSLLAGVCVLRPPLALERLQMTLSPEIQNQTLEAAARKKIMQMLKIDFCKGV